MAVLRVLPVLAALLASIVFIFQETPLKAFSQALVEVEVVKMNVTTSSQLSQEQEQQPQEVLENQVGEQAEQNQRQETEITGDQPTEATDNNHQDTNESAQEVQDSSANDHSDRDATTTNDDNQHAMCGDWTPRGNPGHPEHDKFYKEALSADIQSCGDGSQVGQEFQPDSSQLYCNPDLTLFDRKPALLALDLQRVSPQEQPQFSIVSPSFNVEEVLKQTVPTLCSTLTGKWEVVFVLDGCYDGSLQAIQSILLDANNCNHPDNTLMRARVLCQPHSIFETSSDNLGFVLTNPSHFYVEIQADMLFEEKGWNMDIARPFFEHNDLFSLSGRCGHGGGANEGRCGGNVQWVDEAMRRKWENSFVFKPTNNRGPLIYRADALKNLGYFDEVNYFLGNDDHDLNTRATHQGLKAGFKYVHFYSPKSMSPQRNGTHHKIDGFAAEKRAGKNYRAQRKQLKNDNCNPQQKGHKPSYAKKRGKKCTDVHIGLKPKSETVDQWNGVMPDLPPLTDRTSVEYPLIRGDGKTC